MKKNPPVIQTLCLLLGVLAACGVAFADEIQGAATGWWSDNEGNNYYGSAPSSSSGYGSSYTPDYSGAYSRLGENISAAMSRWAEVQAQKRVAYQFNLQGNQYLSQGKFEQAIAAYEQALTYASDSVIIANLNRARMSLLNAQGLEYHRQGDWNNAIAAYKQALAYNPASRTDRKSTRLNSSH